MCYQTGFVATNASRAPCLRQIRTRETCSHNIDVTGQRCQCRYVLRDGNIGKAVLKHLTRGFPYIAEQFGMCASSLEGEFQTTNPTKKTDDFHEDFV